MIDPPWKQKKTGVRIMPDGLPDRKNPSRNLDYKTLSVAEIEELLVNKILPLANHKHCVFVWTIDKFLIDCSILFKKLKYNLHARLIWDKKNGFPASYTIRYSHEYLLWYYKNGFLDIAKEEKGKRCTVFHGKHREHSRKPDEAYQMIDSFYPGYKKIDVFSREKRDGWDQWGDQVDYFR